MVCTDDTNAKSRGDDLLKVSVVGPLSTLRGTHSVGGVSSFLQDVDSDLRTFRCLRRYSTVFGVASMNFATDQASIRALKGIICWGRERDDARSGCDEETGEDGDADHRSAMWRLGTG